MFFVFFKKRKKKKKKKEKKKRRRERQREKDFYFIFLFNICTFKKYLLFPFPRFWLGVYNAPSLSFQSC